MELVRVCLEEKNDDISSVPPGFEPRASFTLKTEAQDTKRHERDNLICCSASTRAVLVEKGTGFANDESSKITRSMSMRRRPWINYGQYDNSSEDEPDHGKLNQWNKRIGQASKVSDNEVEQVLKQVTARWRPEEACRPDIEDVPVFYPTDEEFEDTLKYIASIRPRAEQYGICRIVPPSSWKPPCPLKEKNMWENSRFATRVQRVDKLQNRDPMRKMSEANNNIRRKRRRCMRMAIDCGPDSGSISGSDTGLSELEGFGFEVGPEFTLDRFQKYADNFKTQYFRLKENDVNMEGKMAILQDHHEPSIQNIEGEYWRIVEKATEEIEVLYGADLETGVFGSGFHKKLNQVGLASDEKYIKSGWNLNNFPRLSGSVLSYESSDISGVLVPWLYVGMCFSSFCWHVEDHHLYSLNYMHLGAPKIWYGVPGKDASKLEKAMRKHLPDLFDEQPDLLHKLIAIELYREQGRKTSISHDKLLLGAAREAVKAHWELNFVKNYTSDNMRWKDVCGKNGVLSKTLKARVEMERLAREFFCSSSQAVKMDRNFDATSERECCICFFDLHLSAAGCRCSPDRYACLNHAKHLCSCARDAKFFLFRYDINELNILVEALEGKLSAIYRWARLDLGMALSSYASKDNIMEGIPKEVQSKPSVDSFKDLQGEEMLKEKPLILTLISNPMLSHQRDEVSEAALPSDDPNSKLKKEDVILFGSDLSMHGGQTAMESKVKKPVAPVDDNINLLSYDEPKKPVLERPTEHFVAKQSEASTKCTENLSPYTCSNEPITDASSPDLQRNGCSFQYLQGKEEHTGNGITLLGSNDLESNHQELLLLGSEKANKEKHENVGAIASLSSVDNARSNVGAPTCSQNNLDRNFRQKGPRIAKVVRRINCNVEPLKFGVVLSGKLWCNSQAIFPKGFKSRVRYISVLDPTNMAYYVSEILDAGRDGPLFMVSVEHCPNEVFIHVSATRCWEMVREQVNQEITKQHRLGRTNLPPLQPPGSLDGFEMFGFSSPEIVQAIEAMDLNRVCMEYWDCRPYSRPQVQIPRHFQPPGNGGNLETTSGEQNAGAYQNNCLPDGVDALLGRLFKKANSAELHSLYSILSDKRSPMGIDLVARLLNEEIHSRG
ncbi:hypothetical protein Godav_001481 [Gossypium davidsonii]|uniref:Lysine-specific demethylase JMJ16 n=1 Tax=Gossypium davidsonii TaxID=34287 RepID=A0A7J8T3N3_GOSDV|nr:hypothetical protein [Gossypium davidsonii]